MSVILKPIVTEKVTSLGELSNRYGFFVDTKANKIQIKEAVESMYDVNVININTMNVRPNRSVKYTKSGILSSKTNAMKKAIVQLKEGETIDFFNNN